MALMGGYSIGVSFSLLGTSRQRRIGGRGGASRIFGISQGALLPRDKSQKISSTGEIIGQIGRSRSD